MIKGEIEPWCSTKVDASGYKVDGYFIYCKDGCASDSAYKEWLAKKYPAKKEEGEIMVVYTEVKYQKLPYDLYYGTVWAFDRGAPGCTPTQPCEIGEGGCTSNADCEGRSYCHQRTNEE